MTEDKADRGQWHGGKGSVQKDHDHDKYSDNWDKIFGKNKGLTCLLYTSPSPRD